MDKRIARILLVAVSFLAIGILVLPSTLAPFAGMHTFYYKEALPCEKCHADVADEFQSSANYHPPGSTYPVWEACVLCHQVEPLYFGDVSQSAGKHAATVVPCDYCHTPEAKAFANDPHYPFVEAAEEDDQMPNGTEACVACHTHASVKINFTWKKYMAFDATVNASADRNKVENLWTISEFDAQGEETHFIVEYGAYLADRNYSINTSGLPSYEDNLH